MCLDRPLLSDTAGKALEMSIYFIKILPGKVGVNSAKTVLIHPKQNFLLDLF